MSWHDHTIDWHALRFSAKMLTAFAVLGISGHVALDIAKSKTYSAAREGAIVVERQVPVINPVKAVPPVTPQRVIDSLTIAETVPPTGKFIAADLDAMKLYLFTNGTTTGEFPISHKGRPGTPWETPSGFYAVQTKEKKHFSSIGKVYMPYSMQFYGNYFIHGETYYPDGTPTAASFSGGCIRLATSDAEKVYEFADTGTRIFVYDSSHTEDLPTLSIDTVSTPSIDAQAYLVADLDTGDVFAEKNATLPVPIASVTKLMTALVANETISFDKKLAVTVGSLIHPIDIDSIEKKTFHVGDLFYPLLMQSSNGVAETLADYYGPKSFVRWMNTAASAIGMRSTTFIDSTGESTENVSTTEDLYRLTAYLSHKKSFILKITRTQSKTITAEDGSKFTLTNVNTPADDEPFEGGAVGQINNVNSAVVTILSIQSGQTQRRIAVIVLGSENQVQDSRHLAEWMSTTSPAATQSACAACARQPYRKIQPY